MSVSRDSVPPAGAPEHPLLSVVVVSLGSGAALVDTVAAIVGQDGAAALEIIVPADDRVHGELRALGAYRSRVRIVPVAGRVSSWALRATGARAAQAAIVATLEDCVRPASDWAQRVLNAFGDSATDRIGAIGGVVDKGTPDTAVGWAMYFLDYGRYIPPRRGGPSTFLSACNVAYRRSALDAVSEAWQTVMHETDVHWALARAGYTLRLDPSIRVSFRRPLSLGAARRELRDHGERFAVGRAATMGNGTRLARVIAAPLVAPLLFARSALPLLRAPRLAPGWLRALPSLAIMSASWAAGEARGYRLRRGSA